MVMINISSVASSEAVRIAAPVAVVCQGFVALGLPDGVAVEMPASVARDAATVLLSVCDDEGAAGRSCVACRHALVCSQMAGVRSALTLREYLNDEGGIWRAIAGSCQLFETAETGVLSPISTTDTGAQ